MTDEQRKRIHAITYSTQDRMELAERIVQLEDENAKLKNNNNYLHEMLFESREANEHLYTELKRHKSIFKTRPNAMTALYDENAKLRELADAVKEFVEDTHCENCPCRRDCDDNNRIFCANDFGYHAFAAMRELGIEATDDD